jgi:hypothetical protein
LIQGNNFTGPIPDLSKLPLQGRLLFLCAGGDIPGLSIDPTFKQCEIGNPHVCNTTAIPEMCLPTEGIITSCPGSDGASKILERVYKEYGPDLSLDTEQVWLLIALIIFLFLIGRTLFTRPDEVAEAAKEQCSAARRRAPAVKKESDY